MPATPFVIDVSPYLTVTGAAVLDGSVPPADVATRLHGLLAGERLVAAVDHDPACGPSGDVLFTVACTRELAVLRVDDAGRLVPGETVGELEASLGARLATEVTLAPDLDDLDDLDDAEDVDDAEDDLFAETVGAGLRDDAVEAELPELAPDLFDDEPAQQVLVLSRRGASNAALLALLARSPVEAGVEDGWSAFRFLDADHLDVPWPSARELPSLRLSFPRDDPHGWAYVDVTTPTARGADTHTVFPTSAAHHRAVLDEESLSAEAARLLAVVVNDHLSHDSAVNQLAADPSLHVDLPALHAAVAPGRPGTTADRLTALLEAIGLPAHLVHAAVHGDPLPDRRRYDGRHVLETLLQAAEDGVRGLSPLGSSPGPVIGSIERAEALLARHPRAAYAFAAGEALLGVATAVAGTRSRGARRTAAVLGGLLLVVDAAVDATVVTRRRRQADPTSNIQEIPNRSVS